MATTAGSQHLRMVNSQLGLERLRCMAAFTGIATEYMSIIFGYSSHTIVTGETIVANACVVKRCRQPGERTVTLITLGTGSNMSSIFPRRVSAVMATGTSALHLVVIDGNCRFKLTGTVACFTLIATGNMANALTKCRDVVVTGNTAIAYQ